MRELHQFTVDNGTLTYYLGGLKNLTGPMRYFSVVGAFSSQLTEALSLAVVEEDVVVRNMESYESCLREEIDWMQNLGEPVWQLLELAACSEGSACRAIGSACLDCAHISCSYVHKIL